jgi:hypothetical protein
MLPPIKLRKMIPLRARSCQATLNHRKDQLALEKRRRSSSLRKPYLEGLAIIPAPSIEEILRVYNSK